MSPRLRMLAAFGIQGVVAAMLFMRIPDVQLLANLSEGQLGLVLTGAPVGAMLTFGLATKTVERFGTRLVMLASYPAIAIAAAVVPLSDNLFVMFSAMFVFGAMNSIGNIAINVEADRLEAASGTRIMNACHGMWSVVFFFATLVAGIIRGTGVSASTHLAMLLPLFGLCSWLIVSPLREFPARGSNALASKWTWPSLSVIAIVAYGIGAELLEGSARVWATIYLRDSFEVPALIESAALPIFVLSMALARLLADRVIDMHGAPGIARLAMFLATVGVLVIVATPSAYVALSGFALAGVGASVAYPLMISSAARIGDRPASENVAALTLVVQTLLLLSPALTGVLADGWGVRAAFAALLPLLLLGMIMSKVVR